MARAIKDVMTPNPVTLQANATVLDAARAMRDSDIGDVIVYKGEQLRGIITDRDIVVRVVAEGKDPAKTSVESFCSRELFTLSPSDQTSDAVKLMKEKAVRRIPVVENNKAVGIVSMGDLAVQFDRESALGAVSAAAPNR